jgi:hypothetical protein
MLVAIVVGDALMVHAQAVLAIYFMDLFFEIYRLWIVWGRNRTVLIFPSCSLTGLLG